MLFMITGKSAFGEKRASQAIVEVECKHVLCD